MKMNGSQNKPFQISKDVCNTKKINKNHSNTTLDNDMDLRSQEIRKNILWV
jgi:hypothetical protein